MEKVYSGPKALTDYILYQSKHKANKSFLILLVQGFLAGMYISIGAMGFLKTVSLTADPGIGLVLGAFIFPVGIIAILLMQAELYTSDSMVMIAVYDHRTKINKILSILLLIIFANLLGTIFFAYLTHLSGMLNEEARLLVIEKAIKKVHLPYGQLLVSAIVCNILVCTGVCLAYSCRDEIAKICVLWLSIAVFVISGTEHVVANMYYLFTALFEGAKLTLIEIFIHLGIAALGNFLGGGVIVSGINYLLARKDIAH